MKKFTLFALLGLIALFPFAFCPVEASSVVPEANCKLQVNQTIGQGGTLVGCGWTAASNGNTYLTVDSNGNLIVYKQPAACDPSVPLCPDYAAVFGITGGPGAFIYMFPNGYWGIFGPNWVQYFLTSTPGPSGSFLMVCSNDTASFVLIAPDGVTVVWHGV